LWDSFKPVLVADSAKLGKGEILQHYRNLTVHPPCCCVYFQPNSRQPAFVTASCTTRARFCGQTWSRDPYRLGKLRGAADWWNHCHCV